MFSWVGLAFLLVLAVGVGVLATLATAGTWWVAVKNGAILLPKLAPLANAIRNLFVPIAAATNLIFTLRNSLKTVGKINNALTAPPKTAESVIKENAPNVHPVPPFNPFLLITGVIKAPFSFLVFIGHIAAVGLTGDRTPGLSYTGMILSAFFSALSDAFVDCHYMIPHDHSHNHDHGLIANGILNIILSPLLLAAALWSKISHPDKPFLSYLKANIGIPEHKAYLPPKERYISTPTQLNNLLKHYFRKEKTRLNNSVDINSLKEIKGTVRSHPLDETENIKALCRLFTQPKAQRIACKIAQEFSTRSAQMSH